MRIVGGRFRGRRLAAPRAQAIRPTSDRLRESLFNILAHGYGDPLVEARVLDLFAGTGALGFEAASRGAARVVLVERDRRARAAIGQTLERLGSPPQLELVAADAFDALRRLASAGERFDLVFVDPPFGESLHLRVLDALPAVLAPGALVYLESGERFEMPAQWRVLREGRAGQVRYHLLSRAADALPGHDA